MPCPPRHVRRRRCRGRRTTMSTTSGTGTRPSGRSSSNARRVAVARARTETRTWAPPRRHTQRRSSCRAAFDPTPTYGTTITLRRISLSPTPTTTHMSRPRISPETATDRRSLFLAVGARCSGVQRAADARVGAVDTVALATMFVGRSREHSRRILGQPMGAKGHTCLTQVKTWP